MQEWPEGPAADPKEARNRYEAIMRADREKRREMLRVSMPAAHAGLALVIAVGTFLAFIVSRRGAVIIVGGFAALFVTSLVVVLARGGRRMDALRRAYLAAFGWAEWL